MHKLVCFLLMLGVLISVVPFSGCASKNGVDAIDQNDRFTQLLSLLPSTAIDAGGFVLVDYDKCFQDIGISRFNNNDKPITFEEFDKLVVAVLDEGYTGKLDFLGLGNFYTGYGGVGPRSPIALENTGYDFTSVDVEIQSIIQTNLCGSFEWIFSNDTYVAAMGRYNPKTVNSALSNQGTWPEWVKNSYESEIYDNTTIHSWQDGNQNHFGSKYTPPHLNFLGRALPLAVDSGHLFVASMVDEIKAMLDTQQKRTKSLAEIPEYALVAKKMTELNASVTIIVDQSLVNGYPDNIQDNPGPLLKKFLTCGMAYGSDAKGDYMTLVIVNKDENDAAQNAALLGQSIHVASMLESDMPGFPGDKSIKELIKDSEITAEGRLTIAKLYTDDPNLWYRWFALRSNLLLHEK
jgi:hypothetical protein